MSLAAEGAGRGGPTSAPGSAADRAVTERYRRLAWLILGSAFVIFCLLCVGAAYAVLRYSEHADEANTAQLEVEYGSKLEVRRGGQKNWTLVSGKTTLNENDSVRTGQDTSALITMFDGSTVQLYYNSTVTLKVMRTSRFLNQFKDIELTQSGGSIKAAAAPLATFASMKFHLYTDDGQVLVVIPASSTALITMPDPPEGSLRMTVAAQAGQVTVRANGVTYPIPLGMMRQVSTDNIVLRSDSAEATLIDNGDFKQLADSSTGSILLAPGWRLSQPRAALDAQHIYADVVSETLGGDTRYSASFAYASTDDNLVRVTMRQEMDKPVNFYRSLEFRASVNIANARTPAGIYPLSVQVSYEDTEGQPHQWERRFYAQQARPSDVFDPAATVLPLWAARWTDLPPTKSPAHWDLLTQAPSPARIKAVEVIITGYSFNISVTNLSLVAR